MKNRLDFHRRQVMKYTWDMDGKRANGKIRRLYVNPKARMASRNLIKAELEEYWEDEIMSEVNDFLYGEDN